MLNKIIKLFQIILVGTTLFASSPLISNAQYYNYYNYAPLNITTTNATNIADSSVVLNGLVNGTNLYNTYNVSTWFEYGTSTSFGYSTLHINSNSGYANFSANVGNLSPNTIYYFRAIGQNAQGVVYGSTNSFRTNFGFATNVNGNNDVYPVTPTIITNSATSVSSRSAKINSFIINDPNSPSTTWFEWGTTPNLNNTTPLVSLGSLSSANHINTITGLAPGTTYYFRAVLQNSSSRINGNTLSFITHNATPTSLSSTTEETTNSTTITNTSVLEPAGSALGANIFGSGAFFPVSILGWLLLIILILVLILFVKHTRRNSLIRKPEHAQEHV